MSETGKAASGAGSNLPASPAVDAISNSPSEAEAEPLPEVPGPANVSEEVGGTTASGVGSSPLLAPTLERDPSVTVTPVPVLQLSILYGLILLFAAGYFWYTARLAKAESSRGA